MKYALSLAACAAVAFAAPTETLKKREGIQARAACAAAVTLAPGSNPFKTRALHANSIYAAEIATAMEDVTDDDIKTKAAEVAEIGTFLWL